MMMPDRRKMEQGERGGVWGWRGAGGQVTWARLTDSPSSLVPLGGGMLWMCCCGGSGHAIGVSPQIPVVELGIIRDPV